MNFSLKRIAMKVGVIIISSILLFACSKDKENPPPVSNNGYSKGIFVVNEGPFGNGTGTISFLKRDGSGLTNEIYQNANSSIPLGSIVQSMTVIGDKAYIVVNDANKIEIVNLKTFELIQTLENVTSPRYIEYGENGKFYVSCWDNTVKIYIADGAESLGQVNVGTGPEKMLLDGQKLWVLNQGGYSIDSTISVIDLSTGQVTNTVDVYPKPTGIQRDKNGLIWVTCSGSGWNGWPDSTDTHGHLICINPIDYSVLEDFKFPTTSEHPEKLLINSAGEYLYYSYPGGICSHEIGTDILNLNPIITKAGMFYGLDIDPEEDVIYGTDAMGFVQNGMLFRYDAYAGVLIDSLEVGIGPAEFCFSK